MDFDGNFADDSGNDVYGGNLDFTDFNQTNVKCITAMNEISSISPSDPSAVSSSPYRVCFCFNHSSEADCLNYTRNVSIYPGQTIYMSAFIVGQHFGTTRGSVYAQIMNKTSGTSIQDSHRLQTVNIRNCSDEENVLTYNVELIGFKESETIILTTENVTLSDYINKKYVHTAIKEYNSANKSYVPPALLDLPVYVIINFLKCPSGFEFTDGACKCSKAFRNHSGRYSVECDIKTGEIMREYSVWIDSQNWTNEKH